MLRAVTTHSVCIAVCVAKQGEHPSYLGYRPRKEGEGRRKEIAGKIRAEEAGGMRACMYACLRLG